jgi:para-aminobenzoate synthetase/4-amino-4-deoxychorismate lyase
VQGGRAVAPGEHLERLAASVGDLYAVTLDRTALAGLVEDAAGGHALARLRISFAPSTGVDVAVTDLAERPRSPWRLVVRRVPGGWGEHKWQDRATLAIDPEADVDPLLVDEDDGLLETGRGNVFVARRGTVLTPPLDGRILPGVSRAAVLDLLPGLGIGRREGTVGLTDLAGVDEVFATNAIGGVRPVVEVRGVASWPAGPLTRAVDAALERRWSHESESHGRA